MEDYTELREKIIGRIILRWSFVFNLLFSGMIILLLLQSYFEGGKDVLGVGVGVLIFGTGIIVHGILAFNLFNRIVDRAVARELERAEKPKRQSVEVGDDGELVEYWEDEQPAKRLQMD